MLKWLDKQGGVEGMEDQGREGRFYDFLDESKMFIGCASGEARSDMNVTFRTASKELDEKFVKEAAAAGFENLMATAASAACARSSTTPCRRKA